MKPLNLHAISEARWLDRDRVNGYAKIFLGLTIAFVVKVAFELGAQGTDFVAFWAAARMALQGDAAAAYDLPTLFAHQAQAGFTHGIPFVNPPPYLALIAPIGWLPYLVALAAFSVLTFAALATALRWMPRDLYWPALAFPVWGMSVIGGQNGMLTGAILIGALGLLPRHKLLAGLLIGAMVIKPQLALLAPVALIAGREWRAFLGAALSSVVLVLASMVLFGVETWLAAIGAQSAISEIIAHGSGVTFSNLQSLLRVGIGLGLSPTGALVLQGLCAAGAATAVWRVWRSTDDPLTRAAIFCAAAPLATPYVLNYDLGLLIVPLVWLAREGVRQGFRRFERVALVACFLAPIPLSMWVTTAPLCPVLAFFLLGVVYLRLRPRAMRAAPRPSPQSRASRRPLPSRPPRQT